MVLSGANAFHAAGQTTRLGGYAERSSLAREWDAVDISFQTACTPTPEAQTGGSEGGLPRAFCSDKVSAVIVVVVVEIVVVVAVVVLSGSATEPTNERTDKG